MDDPKVLFVANSVANVMIGATPEFRLGAVMYLLHTALRWTQARCARTFGFDPTTVRYWVRRIEDARDDPRFDNAMNQLEQDVSISQWNVKINNDT